MPLPAIAVGTAAALEAQGLLKAGSDIYLGGGAEYIKNGQPIGIIPALGQAIARQSCRRYADGVGSISPEAAANYEKACRPYLDDIGYGSPPSIELPFEGGQCPGARYVVNATGTTPNNAPQTFDTIIVGPIRYNQDLPPVPEFTGCSAQSGPWRRFSIFGSDNQGTTWVGCGATFTVNSVTPFPNAPNNCGDPPPEVTEPQPPAEPGPKFEPIVVVPIIDIDAGVTVNIDGTVEIELGDLNVTIDPFGDDDDEGPPGGGGEDAPGTPEPGPELPGGNGGFGGDDGFGEPPAGKRWIGACIRIVATPQGAGVIPQSVPDDVYPTVIGNLRLVGAPGGSRLTDTPIQVRAKHVCVWEPVRGFNPTGVSVDLLPGYGYTYRPYAVPEDN